MAIERGVVISILAPSFSARALSSIRRSLTALGAKVHIVTTTTNQLSPGTSHLLLSELIVCPVLVLAVASASSIRLVTQSFADDCVKYSTLTPPPLDSHIFSCDPSSPLLDVSDKFLWIGRVWLGAYHFWRNRADQGNHAPLHSHRVLIVGQTRPRGAARLFAPTSAFVKNLVLAAGGIIVNDYQSDLPTIAIVAPDLNSENSDAVAFLLKKHVICLAPAFLIDLIIRVSADPSDYVLFSTQRDLCASALDVSSVSSQKSPLQVSRAQPDDSIMNLCEGEVADDAQNVAQTLYVNRTPVTLRLKAPSASLPNLDLNNPQRDTSCSNTSVAENPSNAHIEIVDLTVPEKKFEDVIESPTKPVKKFSPCSFQQVSSPNRHVIEKRPTQSKRVRSNGPYPFTDRRRFSTQQVFRSYEKGYIPCKQGSNSDGEDSSRNAAQEMDEPKRKSKMGISEAFSFTSHLSSSGKPIPVQARLERSRRDCNLHEQSNNENVKQRKLKYGVRGSSRILASTETRSKLAVNTTPHGDKSHTVLGKGAEIRKNPSTSILTRNTNRCSAIQNKSRSLDEKISLTHGSVAQSNTPQEVDEFADYVVEPGFDLIMTSLGGEPSDRAVKQLLKSLNAPKDLWLDLDDESQSKHVELLNLNGSDDSPILFEENEIFNTTSNPPSINDLCSADRPESSAKHTGDEVWLSQSTKRPDNSSGSQNVLVDLSKIIVPRHPVLIKGVIPPELGFLEKAHSINIAPGNNDDDHACQTCVSLTDWLLGAEHLVGLVASDSMVLSQNGFDTQIRRLWLSLLESNVFDRLLSPGGFSNSQIRHLVGVCVRLVTCHFQPEMCCRVLREMLKPRENRFASNLDSLRIVFVSPDIDKVSFRHRAIAALWAIVVHLDEQAEGGDRWNILDHEVNSVIDKLFDSCQSLQSVHPKLLSKNTTLLLEMLWIVSVSFAFRTDLFNEEVNADLDNATEIYPENWKMFCRLLGKVEKWAQSPTTSQKDAAQIILTSVLEFTTSMFCGKLWRINEDFLSACSRAVHAVSNVGKHTCFCDDTRDFSKSFKDVHTHGNLSQMKVVPRTGCDYLFYLGWSYVNHGTGNGMKRAMNAIRIASIFTTGNETTLEQRIRQVRHHVGLVLSLADCIARFSNGEHHVCTILISKCSDFAGLLKCKDVVAYSENEQKWDCVLNGVVGRCRMLLDCGHSVHVYVEWFFSSIQEALKLIDLLAERRRQGVNISELHRVQESLLWTSVLNRLRCLQNLLQLIWDSWSSSTLRKETLLKCVSSGQMYGTTLLLVIRDWIRSGFIGQAIGESKRRKETICAIIGVITFVTNSSLLSIQSSEPPSSKGPGLGNDASGIVCTQNVELMLDLIRSDDIFKETERPMYKQCFEILGTFIELLSTRKVSGWGGSEWAQLIDVIQSAGLDITNQTLPISGKNGCGEETLDAKTTIQFWWRALTKMRWLKEAIQSNKRIKNLLVSVTIWLIIIEGARNSRIEHESDQMIRDIRGTVQNLECFSSLYDDWVGYTLQNVAPIHFNRNSRCVKILIESFAEDWGRVGSRTIVSQLKQATQDLIRNTRVDVAAENGIRIMGYLFKLESQARGFCSGVSTRWMHEWILKICEGIECLRPGIKNNGDAWIETCEVLLGEVLCGLSMAKCDGRNVELRVDVLRLINTVGDANDLSGVWRAGPGNQILFVQGMSEQNLTEVRRNVDRNINEWKELILHGAVEDRLSCMTQSGSGRASALRRLVAAARESQRLQLAPLKQCVMAVIGRVRSNRRVEAIVKSDSIGRLLWNQACDAISLL